MASSRALAVGVAALMVGVPTAIAHDTSTRTDLFIQIGYPGMRNVDVTGHLESPNEKCVPDRTVKLFAVEDSGIPEETSDDTRTLLDKDRTNANGVYSLKGKMPTGTDYITVALTRENIGASGHKHFCEGSSGSYTV